MKPQCFLNQSRYLEILHSIVAGGIIVPNNAKTIPHFRKIAKLKAVVCVANAKPKTIIAPPNSIYRLRCAEEILRAILFAVNIVVVKDAAAKIPK